MFRLPNCCTPWKVTRCKYDLSHFLQIRNVYSQDRTMDKWKSMMCKFFLYGRGQKEKYSITFLGLMVPWSLHYLATKVGSFRWHLPPTINTLLRGQPIIQWKFGMEKANNAFILLMIMPIKFGVFLTTTTDQNSCLCPKTKVFICTPFLYDILKKVLKSPSSSALKHYGFEIMNPNYFTFFFSR